MIEESQYVLPCKKEQMKPKPKADPETLKYLEALPFRPHGVEW